MGNDHEWDHKKGSNLTTEKKMSDQIDSIVELLIVMNARISKLEASKSDQKNENWLFNKNDVISVSRLFRKIRWLYIIQGKIK